MPWDERAHLLQGLDSGVLSFTSTGQPGLVSYIARQGGPGNPQWRVWSQDAKTGEVVWMWQDRYGSVKEWSKNKGHRRGGPEQYVIDTVVGGPTLQYLDTFWRLFTASFEPSDQKPHQIRHNWVQVTYGAWAFNPEIGAWMPEQVAVKMYSSKDRSEVLELQSIELARSVQAPTGWPLIDAGKDELADKKCH